MTNDSSELAALQQQTKTREGIVEAIAHQFAAEDDALQHALSAAKKAGLPEIQISPIQGKLLQLLAVACNAQKILEIGSLGGYSGIWLARGLSTHGSLITLEINPTHADVVRNAFVHAGLEDRTEVRVGNALELLPNIEPEAPFDLIFIDADKPPYPQYLDWALRLSRPGSIIVADNTIRGGKGFEEPQDDGMAGIVAYNKRIASDPRLISLELAIDDDFTDGFAISVVRQ